MLMQIAPEKRKELCETSACTEETMPCPVFQGKLPPNLADILTTRCHASAFQGNSNGLYERNRLLAQDQRQVSEQPNFVGTDIAVSPNGTGYKPLVVWLAVRIIPRIDRR